MAVVFYDTFTDTNKAITDHTPDTNTSGNPWVDITSPGGSVLNNQYTSANAQLSAVDMAISDGTLSANFDGNGTTNLAGFGMRVVDENNFWLLRANTNGAGSLEIYQREGGTYTLRAGVSQAVSSETIIQYGYMNGSTLELRLGTLGTTSYTSGTFNQTATIHGLRLFSASGDIADDFTVNSIAGAATGLFMGRSMALLGA